MALRSFQRCLRLGLNYPKSATNMCCSGKLSQFIPSSWVNNHQTFTTSKTISRENSTDASGEPLKKEVESPLETDSERKLKLEIEKLNEDIGIITKKSQELEDKYKRALADGENLRKRLTKQIDDAKIFGIQNFCKDLLEVADILAKATESVPKEEVSDSNPHLKSLYEGLVMTELQLQKVFKKHGLVPMNPIEEKFDPNLHEALFQQEVQGKSAGTIVVVSKIGYKLHERVIRPALVGVAKGP
ncbi:grpE protein homolog 1, mitochondrial isoform X1 [Ischnura elegans]|uniref:grpE protein homolog 1, mitochondrial isoform X1 n=1 Tax=Ischnura elegans TaxID=197161 RepID=UPI001ED8BAA1|nr:grpE protein homolog 1, mitochondrial isoform X1 [Ischnura elegans]